MGIPIVTTNVPGCKDVIKNNVTGFLCKEKNIIDLTAKMERMLNLKRDDFIKMKYEARKRSVKLFDDNLIQKAYNDEITDVLRNLV